MLALTAHANQRVLRQVAHPMRQMIETYTEVATRDYNRWLMAPVHKLQLWSQRGTGWICSRTKACWTLVQALSSGRDSTAQSGVRQSCLLLYTYSSIDGSHSHDHPMAGHLLSIRVQRAVVPVCEKNVWHSAETHDQVVSLSCYIADLSSDSFTLGRVQTPTA